MLVSVLEAQNLSLEQSSRDSTVQLSHSDFRRRHGFDLVWSLVMSL